MSLELEAFLNARNARSLASGKSGAANPLWAIPTEMSENVPPQDASSVVGEDTQIGESASLTGPMEEEPPCECCLTPCLPPAV